MACTGTKSVWKDKKETVNKATEVEYWLNCLNMEYLQNTYSTNKTIKENMKL